jgi:PAS domain S-box-containing protein
MDVKLIKVLIIEDDLDYYQLIKDILSESEQPTFLVEHREKLSQGLERLIQGNIDIILLDLGLPDSSGIKTFMYIHSNSPDIPIIILTGIEDDRFAIEAVHRGAQDFLFKGLMDPDSMIRAIKYAIERKKIEKELKEARDQLEKRVKERTAELEKINVELLDQIAERKKAEKVLKESEKRLDLALKGTNVGLWDWNVQTGKMIVDERWANIVGCTLKELSPISIETWDKLTHPHDLKRSYELFESHFARKTEYYQCEARMEHKNGEWVWVFAQGKVFEWDKDGRPLRMAGTLLDITKRKRAEEELRKYRLHLEELVKERTAELTRVNKELEAEITERKRAEEQIKATLKEKEVLLKEIHHRVKNNLQLINSLLNLQSRRIHDEKGVAIFEECKNRVNSIALIHEKLYESEDMANINYGEYVRSLTNHLFNSSLTSLPGVTLKINADDVFLKVDKAIPCALIINELVTNAIKYGFPQGQQGEIIVGLQSADKGKVILTVADNGVGLPADFNMNDLETLGMQIISALAKKLHGSIKIDRSKGTKFTMEFQI